MKILANDGLHPSAVNFLTENGFEVFTTKVAQEQVANYLNKNEIDILVVKQGTRVDDLLLRSTNTLKGIGKLTDNMDDIDLKIAQEKNIPVFFANSSTKQAQAELVMAHLMSGARNLHQTNREMPLEGDSNFKQLTKYFCNGSEIKGKTLGLIGFDAVAEKVAKLAFGLGMKVMVHASKINSFEIEIAFFDSQKLTFHLPIVDKKGLLENSDFISIHQQSENHYTINENDFQYMKKGVGLINIQQGKIIDEVALIDALNDDTVSFAGLDAFENQPNPEMQLLMHPKISLSPNIAAKSNDNQEKIDLEVANEMVNYFLSLKN
jgi:D-3-phosphoglycerate dehydrogenase